MLNAYRKLHPKSRRDLLLAIAVGIAPMIGWLTGFVIGDPIAERAARQHNLTVIATVECAAKNYSRVGAPRDHGPGSLIPMSDLDDYYR
jgi:hypothetical protein